MHQLMLITHFVGLSIGAGTGIYMAALSSYAAKLPDKAAAKAVMLGPGAAVSSVGLVGLILLLVSGAGMVFVDDIAAHWAWAFRVKMLLVGLIVIYIAAMHRLGVRAKQETTPRAAFTMKKLGPIGPLLAVFTIIAAVMAFQ
jgi:uncharacterized membrane protein YbhN (UPF0104 family)